jgi:hypothetical protein
VEIPKKDNCAAQSNIFPFACELCNPDFFYFEAECKPVTTKIEHCLEYSHTDKCSKCEKNYLLTKNICMSLAIESNCEYFRETEAAFCVLCSLGYSLQNDGSCVRNNKAIPRCLISDSKIEKCLICNTGYYMNEKQECQVWGQDTIIPDNQNKFLNIIQLWNLLILVLYLV